MTIQNHSNYEAALEKAKAILEKIKMGKNEATLRASGKLYSPEGDYTQPFVMEKEYVGGKDLFARAIEETFLDAVAAIILSDSSAEEKKEAMTILTQNEMPYLYVESAHQPQLCIRRGKVVELGFLDLKETLNTSQSLNKFSAQENKRAAVLMVIDHTLTPLLKEYAEQNSLTPLQTEILKTHYFFPHQQSLQITGKFLKGDDITPSLETLLDKRFELYDELAAKGWKRVATLRDEWEGKLKYLTSHAQIVLREAKKAGYAEEDILIKCDCRDAENVKDNYMISPLGIEGNEKFEGLREKAEKAGTYKFTAESKARATTSPQRQ